VWMDEVGRGWPRGLLGWEGGTDWTRLVEKDLDRSMG
jgi:hypothetical protein